MKAQCLKCRSNDIFIQRPRVICNDGVSLSIQAGQSLYSIPRENVDYYSAVEVGFIEKDDKPFTPPESWSEFADGSFPSDVYGYVPIEVVESFIAEHGGRKNFC